MKKKLFIAVGIGAGLLLLALAVLGLFLGTLIKSGVEALAPQMTKTTVTLEDASLSPLSGKGSLSGLTVGNPEGYTTAQALHLGQVEWEIVPRSVFTQAIEIRRVYIRQPQMAYESNLARSNLGDILKNVKAATGGGRPAAEPAPTEEPGSAEGAPASDQKRFIIDLLIIEDAAVEAVILGSHYKLTLPRIELKDIGREQGGVTATEAAYEVLHVVMRQVVQAASDSAKQEGGFSLRKFLGQ